MAITVETHSGDLFPVRILHTNNMGTTTVTQVYSHSALADLYLALTDFYASPDNATHKENRP